MKQIATLTLALAIGWFFLGAVISTTAMDKCQEKFSYSTCVHTLR